MVFHIISHFEFDGIPDDWVMDEYDVDDLHQACKRLQEDRGLNEDQIQIEIVRPYCAKVIDRTIGTGEVFFVVESGMCWPYHQQEYKA